MMLQEFYNSVSMFVFLGLELSILFLSISFLVGLLQKYIPPEKIEALLSSKNFKGYILAAFIGAITPFCSCSTIPMLKGLIRARTDFGPLMVFLFSSPLLNPVIVILLIATFGIKLSTIYVIVVLIVSISAGWLLQVLHFDRFIKTLQKYSNIHSQTSSGYCSTQTKPDNISCNKAKIEENNSSNSCCNDSSNKALPTTPCYESEQLNTVHNKQCCRESSTNVNPDIKLDTCSATEGCTTNKTNKNGLKLLWQQAWADYKDVLPYLLIGIAIGSVIYGFMPTGLLKQYAGADNPFAIPVAAIIGVPLYIRAEAVIPLATALMAKGVGAGTVLALIIGSAGASLTELILLRSLFRMKLIATFVAVIFTMAIIAGYAAYLFF